MTRVRRQAPMLTDAERAERAKHEEGIVRGFIAPGRRSRYLELLLNPRRREDITSKLDHMQHLDPACLRRIPSTHGLAPGIVELLKALGAPDTCWLVSSSDELDGQKMLLSDALREIVGRGIGTFISCIPGKLGYFEDEDCSYILVATIKPQR